MCIEEHFDFDDLKKMINVRLSDKCNHIFSVEWGFVENFFGKLGFFLLFSD